MDTLLHILNMNKDHERRTEPRIPADGQVSMKVVYGNTGEGHPVGFRLAEDFSRHGVRFASSTPVTKDQEVILRIGLPHERLAIEKRATIRWATEQADSNKFDVGVEFTDASSKDVSIWERFIYHQQNAVA